MRFPKRRRVSRRSCDHRAVFVDSRFEDQLLVTDKVIHIWAFSEGETLLRWAEEWRKEWMADGSVDTLLMGLPESRHPETFSSRGLVLAHVAEKRTCKSPLRNRRTSRL